MPDEMTLPTIETPAPTRCAACGGVLAPWRVADPQDGQLRRRYRLLRCAGCGSASTAGPPEPELYESGVYAADTTRVFRLVEGFRRLCERQKLVLLRASVPPPASVLEVGAGQGRFVSMARSEGYAASGFEPSSKGVAVAAGRGVELDRAGIGDAEVESGSADAVVLWHVLEHLDDPGFALERIRGWLRDDGVLLVGVPNIASVQARIAGARWLHLDPPRHRHHFTPVGLRRLLSSRGFVIESEHQVLLEHNPFGMWQAWLDRLTTTQSYAYNLIKRNASPSARDLIPTALVTVLAPLAVLSEAVAGMLGRGGTMAVLARRPERCSPRDRDLDA